MKYFFIITLLLVSLIAVPEGAVAQKLSKKERKELKKKQKELKKEKKKRMKALKKMSVEEFAAQKDNSAGLETRIAELEGQLVSTQNDLAKKESTVQTLEDQVKLLEEQAQSATAPAVQQNVPMASTEDTQYNQGLVFRVQIGAYKNQDLSQYDTSENFTNENGDAGMSMYTLGNFRDYWEADKFKKYLRKMGVRDAWIVPYEDGTRGKIKDVLERLRIQKQKTASN